MELLMVLWSHAFSCLSSRPSRFASGYFFADMFDMFMSYQLQSLRLESGGHGGRKSTVWLWGFMSRSISDL